MGPLALADPIDPIGIGIGKRTIRIELATLNTVVFAPMQTASVSVAASAKNGSRRKLRTA